MSAAAAGTSAPAGQASNITPATGTAGAAGSGVSGAPANQGGASGAQGSGASVGAGGEGGKPAASLLTSIANGAQGQQGETGSATGGSKDGKPGEAGELDLKLPDGVKADEPMVQWFKPLAKELGLTADNASKLVAGYVEHATKAMQTRDAADLEAFTRQDAEWANEIKADPKYGGANWAQTEVNVARFMADQRYGGRKVADLLGKYGLGSHPDVMRLYADLGAAIKSDSSVTTTPGGDGAAMSDVDRARKLYPSMYDGNAAGG